LFIDVITFYVGFLYKEEVTFKLVEEVVGAWKREVELLNLLPTSHTTDETLGVLFLGS
jgi:hypothetical protein